MLRIVAILLTIATPALAQTFTTAAEVKPILAATKASWIAVREYEGQDLVYFTNLLAWRCGVSAVSCGLNGAAPETPLAMEPCHEDEAQPNALKMDGGPLVYITEALSSVQSVKVLVTYDDGSTEEADYQRKDVLTP